MLSMSYSKHVFFLEVSNEGNSSFGLGYVEVFLELMVLRFKKHGDLITLLFFEIGLLFRAIRGGMAAFAADGTLDVELIFGLEGAGPSAVTFLLAIFAIILIDPLYLHVVAI